jgi:hypothetical protein
MAPSLSNQLFKGSRDSTWANEFVSADEYVLKEITDFGANE